MNKISHRTLAMNRIILSLLILLAFITSASAQNTVSFDNQSSEAALVKLIGPTTKEIEVPDGTKQTLQASAGKYFIKVRYGVQGKYHYTKGQEFTVDETATTTSDITITLHKVVNGNYDSSPINEDEFGVINPVKATTNGGAPTATAPNLASPNALEREAAAKQVTDKKNEAVALMQSTPEQAQQASKRLAELVLDQDAGVRNQAAFSTVRLGQRLGEKLRSPELESSLLKMISKEFKIKNDTVPNVIADAAIKEGQKRKAYLFMMPCLYSGVQALGEIHASSSESFDLVKRLLQSEDLNVRSVAAYAIATIDHPTEKKLRLLQDRERVESEKDVKEIIEGSIAVLTQNSQSTTNK